MRKFALLMVLLAAFGCSATVTYDEDFPEIDRREPMWLQDLDDLSYEYPRSYYYLTWEGDQPVANFVIPKLAEYGDEIASAAYKTLLKRYKSPEIRIGDKRYNKTTLEAAKAQ